MSESIEKRLADLGIVLPAAIAPIANYVPSVLSGNLLFISGQGAAGADGRWLTGRVPDQIGADEGYQRARATGLRILTVARQALGSLDRVQRVVKILGFVNATPDFHDHPGIINGCSDLLVEVFGDRGRHSRSAVGVASLPVNLSVEIEAVFEVR
jgi:enamine deaminase RidA (YjgF/YER057c/UK114 family)